MILADVVSISVIPYTILPFLLFLWSKDMKYRGWGVGSVVSSWLTFAIKEGGRRLGCLDHVWCRRPSGAMNCNTWMNDGNQGGAPGFPSGHMATTAAFWMGLWLLMSPGSTRMVVGILGIVAVITMAWARIQKRCHSWIQVSGGGMLGVLVSVGILH